jgi:mono/diheme cytochrome c family protein
MRGFGLPALIVGAVAIICLAGNAPEPVAAADMKQVTYAKDVQPILTASCVDCHNAEKRKAGVDLSSYATVKRIVIAEKPDASKLFKCVSGAKGAKKMPPKKPLPEDQVATIKSWIAAGAKEK